MIAAYLMTWHFMDNTRGKPTRIIIIIYVEWLKGRNTGGIIHKQSHGIFFMNNKTKKVVIYVARRISKKI